ncbi:hypothetical protein GMMP1_1540003 [Candidatus Magnetomoraceae bacterium gMMP-1]
MKLRNIKIFSEHKSVFMQIFLPFLMICCGITIISGIVYYKQAKAALMNSIYEESSNMVKNAAENFTVQYSIPIMKKLRHIASCSQMSDYLMSTQEELLFQRLNVEKMFLSESKYDSIHLSLRFIDEYGQEKIIIYGNKRKRDYKLLDEISENDVFGQNIKNLFMNLQSKGTSTIAYTGPFYDKKKRLGFLAGIDIQEPEAGGFGGVIIQYCDLTNYINQMSKLKIIDTPTMWIRGSNGENLLSPPKSKVKSNPWLLISENQNNNFYVLTTDCDLTPNGNPILKLACFIPQKVMLRKLEPIIWLTVALFSVLAIMSLICSFIISQKISKPIRKLTDATENLSLKNIDIKLDPELMKYKNEIGHLARSFNKMTKWLKSTLENLRLEVTVSRIAQNALQNAHNLLEQRVMDRTSELLTFNEQLQQEIIEHNMTQKKLQKAKKDAEIANRLKSAFLANVSHEVRTPLNWIMGYAQSLKTDKKLNECQQKAVETIERSGRYLLALINDILDMSKIEAQELELHQEDFQFSEFLNNIIEIIGIRTSNKGILFNFEHSNDLPAGIHADKERLNQVLLNLLNNAVKFTNKGSITFKIFRPLPESNLEVKAEIESSFKEKPSSVICFQVEDTGIGIPESELENIFSPFNQLSDIMNKTEGTGLGLSISRKYIEAMGGELRVKSTEGKGSTFWFNLNLFEAFEYTEPMELIKQSVMDSENSDIQEDEILIVPSESMLKELYEATQYCDFISIHKLLNKIEQTDIQYFSFVKKIRKMADIFDGEEIGEFLKELGFKLS